MSFDFFDFWGAKNFNEAEDAKMIIHDGLLICTTHKRIRGNNRKI